MINISQPSETPQEEPTRAQVSTDYRADDRSRGVDFADCLIGKTNQALGCEQTATFDKAAATLAEFEAI